MGEWTDADTKALADLIDQAEREGKWLWCYYQDIWYSPAGLRRANAEGRMLWGVVNWKLRDPQERLENARKAARSAAEYAAQVEREVQGEQNAGE